MPIYQYDRPDPNRYAGSIADILAQQGVIQGRRAEQVGHAWAGAAQDIGHTVAAIPQQIQQQKRAALQDQAATLQVQGAQQAAHDDQLFRQALALSTGGDLRPAVAFLTKQGGAGIVALQKLTAMVQQQRDQHNEAAGEIGYRIVKAGATPDAVARVLGDAVKAGDLSDDDAQQFYGMAIEQPGKVPDLARELMARSKAHRPLLDKIEWGAPGRVGFDFMHQPIPGASVPEDPNKGDYTGPDGIRRHKDSTPVTGEVMKPQPPARGLQTEKFRLDGKDVLGTFDPAAGTYHYNGQDVTGRATPIPAASIQINNANKAGAPGDFSKSGDDFLLTIPAQWRATVKKVAFYDEDPTKVVSMRGGNREMLMQWVNQVNPGYKADEFANRAPTRKAFTTGLQGQQINAINTAIGHIDQLTTLAAELGNGGFVPANKAFNVIRTMFGSNKVTNFDTLKDALAGEVSSVLAKSGATVSGIAEAKEKIHGANSPQQLAGYVTTMIPVLGSKLSSLDYQYHQAMGEEDAFSALSPQVKTILTKHGFDPEHPTIQPSSETAAAVPGNVAATLKGQKAGRYTLSDGSVWLVQADGSVVKGGR